MAEGWVTADALAGATKDQFKTVDGLENSVISTPEAQPEVQKTEETAQPGVQSQAPETQNTVQEPAQNNVQRNVQETVQENVQGNVKGNVQGNVQEPKPSAQESPKIEPSKSWEEILKDQGFGDFEIDLLKYKKATGSVQKYLEVKAVDYDKMGAEDLLRKKISEENPGISQRALEFKLKEELKKYPLDPELYDEEQIEAGKELLEFDANRVRAAFKESQAKFAEPIVDREQETIRQQEEYQRQVQQYQNSIKNHPAAQSLVQNKRLVLDGGKDKFNFEVGDPNAAIDLIIDGQKWQQTVSNPDGSPNVGLLLEVAAFINNRQQVYQQLINYGKTLGEKKVVEEELHNVPQPEQTAPAAPQGDLFSAILGQLRK